MAEENIDSQVISQKIESEELVEKVNLKGRLIITKDGNETFSRYLSGPTGSCHDICKYGVKHAADEPKPWSSKLKKIVKMGRKTKLPKETVIYVAKKKSTNGPKPSPTSRFAKPNSPVVIKEVAPPLTNEENFPSEKNLPTFEETDVPMEHTGTDLNQKQSEQSTLTVKECPNGHTNKEKVKSKTPIRSSSRKKSESISQQIRAYSFAGKKISVSPTHSLSSKNYVKKSSSGSAKIAKNLKGVSCLNNQKNVKYVNPEPAGMPEKILHVINSTPENESVGSILADDATELSSAPPSMSMDKSLKETNKPIRKSGRPASSRKSFRHAGNGIRPTKSMASSSQFSGSKSKTYGQHKVRSTSSWLSSSSSSHSPSPPPPSNSSLGKQIGATSTIGKQNRATSKHTKIGRNYQGESAKLAYKIRPKRITVAGVGNKVIQAQKLSFSRGKVIELKPQSNNIPRRLKFRPVRLLSDIQKDTDAVKRRTTGTKEVDNGKSKDAKVESEKVLAKPQNQIMEGRKRRSFRKKAVDGSKLDGLKAESQKVVLRHQNMEGKRVTRRLYNNVIEETASKLTEQRQSKVKALVGAFETVITLDSHITSSSATSTNY